MSDTSPAVVAPDRNWIPRPAVNSRRKIIRAALIRALDEDMGDGTRAIDAFARAQVRAAIDGSVEAGKFVADRVDGKQLANAEVAGDGEHGPVIDDARVMRALALLVAEMQLGQRTIEGRTMSADAQQPTD